MSPLLGPTYLNIIRVVGGIVVGVVVGSLASAVVLGGVLNLCLLPLTLVHASQFAWRVSERSGMIFARPSSPFLRLAAIGWSQVLVWTGTLGAVAF